MKYSFFEFLILVKDFLLTKCFFNQSRLLRFPIDIRGKNSIDFGKKLTTGRYCRLEGKVDRKEKTLFFGENIQINDFVHITAYHSVIIEDNVLIASKVYISDTSHGYYSGENSSNPYEIARDRKLVYKKVKICKNVWLGENVSVLPGVTIGVNSIIGANSVVCKDIPENVIAVGSPAKIIKRYNFKTEQWEKTNEMGEFLDVK